MNVLIPSTNKKKTKKRGKINLHKFDMKFDLMFVKKSDVLPIEFLFEIQDTTPKHAIDRMLKNIK